MNNLVKIFILIITITIPNNQNLNCMNNSYESYFPYNLNDFYAMLRGSKRMKSSNLMAAPLNKRIFPNEVNLSNSVLHGASFRNSKLKKATLIKVAATGVSFRWTNLKSSDLSHSNFSGAYFFGANL